MYNGKDESVTLYRNNALLGAGIQLSLGTTVAQIDTLLYDLRMENPTLPANVHISDDL